MNFLFSSLVTLGLFLSPLAHALDSIKIKECYENQKGELILEVVSESLPIELQDDPFFKGNRKMLRQLKTHSLVSIQSRKVNPFSGKEEKNLQQRLEFTDEILQEIGLIQIKKKADRAILKFSFGNHRSSYHSVPVETRLELEQLISESKIQLQLLQQESS